MSLLATLIANEEDVPASRNIMTNLRAILRNKRSRSFGFIVLFRQMTVIVAMVTVSSKGSIKAVSTAHPQKFR